MVLELLGKERSAKVSSNPIVSVVQAGSVPFDLQGGLEKVSDLASDGARRGAGLVVFPEAFLSGYPKGLDFGARVGLRSPEGRDQYGRCFVLSSCQYIKRGAFPADYPCIQGDEPDTVLIRGGSCIVNPFGEFLVEPNYEGEGVFTAELDLGLIAKGKYDLDVAGHYARPDVFRLYVNESPQRASVFTRGARKDPFDESGSGG